MAHSLLPAEANLGVFDRLAPRYDLLNTVLSFGLDRRWRRKAVGALAPRDGERYLDIGCGPGNVALEVLHQAPGALVVGLDRAQGMLARAATKAARAGVGGRLALAAGDACDLPFPDEAFSGLTSAFALRSFADRARAFAEMRRVLAPGGRAALLELTVPPNPLLRAGYWVHTRGLGMALVRLLSTEPVAYRLLLRSVDEWPPAEEVVGELRAAGFAEARFRRMSGGVATLYMARVA